MRELTNLLAKYGTFTKDELRGLVTDGDPEKLSLRAVEMLCKFRAWHNYPTFITSAYRDDNGTHGMGLAFDQVLYSKWKQSQPNPFELWRIATTFPFWGVGMYFDWEVGGEPVVGLHTDISQESNRPLRWIRQNGVYYYEIDHLVFQSNKETVITLKSAIQNYGRTH